MSLRVSKYLVLVPSKLIWLVRLHSTNCLYKKIETALEPLASSLHNQLVLHMFLTFRYGLSCGVLTLSLILLDSILPEGHFARPDFLLYVFSRKLSEVCCLCGFSSSCTVWP